MNSQTEADLLLAFNSASVGHWVWDTTKNTIVFSDAWRKLRGVSKKRHATIEDSLLRVHPDDRSRLESGREQVARGELEGFSLDYRVEKADGSWTWVEERTNAIRDDTGKVIRVVGCDIDITERKQAELKRAEENQRALRDSERKFSNFAASAPVAIFRMSEDPTDCVYVNERWGELSQQPTEAALGRGWMRFVHPDHLGKLQTGLTEFASDPTRLVTEPYKVKRVFPDGSTSWVQCTIAKELDDCGKVTGFVGTITDISDVKQAEEKVKELNDRLQNVLETSFIGIWEWSFADERLIWDDRMLEIYGVKPSEFTGSHADWTDRVHPDDVERAQIASEREIENGQTALEFRIVRPNGELRHVYSRFNLETDDDGGWARITGINVDVTDRRETELALVDAQRQITRITNNVPGMIYRYVLRADGTQAMTYLTPQCHELFGVDAEEVLMDGNAIFRYVHPDDVERIRAAIYASAETHASYDEEFRVIVSERNTEWRKVLGHLTLNESGDAVWDGVALDITDRKLAEAALQEAKSLAERIAENVPGMVYRHVFPLQAGPDGTFISSKSQQMFGVEPEAAIEDVTRLFQWIHPDDLREFSGKVQESVEELKPLLFEYRVNHPEKGMRWYRTHGQPDPLGQGKVAFDGLVLDITEQKHAELELQRANEELARATKMKDEFLATMSHELRTPLNAILGMNEGLSEGIYGPINDRQLDSLDVIQQSGSHLLELINEVLDLSKIESGSLELQLAPVNLARLCEASFQLIAKQAEKKSIRLTLKLPDNLPYYEADEKRLRQVIVNLLSNAVKFTPDGGLVTLEVERPESQSAAEVHRSDNDEELLRISVSDNGIGIASSDLKNLFDPFVQVDSSLSRKYTGTGLGLSLVKRFVELHSGSVHVESELGKGSRFSVELPLRRRRSADGSQRSRNTVAQSKDGGTREPGTQQAPFVLLAEDDELVAKTTVRFLNAFDYRVQLVTDGNLAINAARKLSPDIILMDVQMPEVDGLEAIRQIRQMPKHEKTPIIALTGLAMRDDANRCLATGANGYLSKPYGMRQLVDLIRETLSERTIDENNGPGQE